MLMSKLFLPTLREVPADATVVSHQLMLRAGMIRKVASGIYTFLPLGLRVLKKVSTIIQEEMDRAGAQEILMPMVQPAELWQESGRFEQYGPELLRFQDRKESWFCLGPTHEEVVTALVRDHVKSYKGLPLNLYQIQTKFRDEIRPRFGLMRGREFIMKDAYSFCADKESQDEVYRAMSDAYHRIFERCGLKFRAVKAATGSIGGDMSHEFQVLAQSGEDAIANCEACGYAANVELAEIHKNQEAALAASQKTMQEVLTPGLKTVAEQAQHLKVSPATIIKSLLFLADERLCLALVLGDQEVSEAKLKAALGVESLAIASEATAAQSIGPIGFIGPMGIDKSIKVIADNSLLNKADLICGANKKDTHFSGVNVAKDTDAQFFDIKQAADGDACGQCGKPFEILRGIEVGHIFYLGKKYSKALNAAFQNEKGEKVIMEMGCYGIGVSRTAAAAIEQNHDEKGIIWPSSIAPYQVHLVQLGVDEDVSKAALDVYQKLQQAGIEVLLDDRDERAGVKLNDADLIGCPLRITLGSRGLKNQEMEALRRDAQSAGPVMLKLDGDWLSEAKKFLS